MSGTRHAQLRHASPTRWALAGVLGLGVLGLAGCGGKPAPKPVTVARPQGTLRDTVISGSPLRDSVAYHLADEKLTEADWRLLEKLGPRPIWEQLQLKKK